MNSNNAGIIYPNDDLSNRKSSIIISKYYCLAPAVILTNLLLKNEKTSKQFSEKLASNEVIKIDTDKNWNQLKSLKFSILTYDTTKNHTILLTAQIAFIWNCSIIRRTIDNILDGLHINGKSKLDKLLLTSFVLLTIKGIGTEIEIEKFALTTTNSNVKKLDKICSITTPFANESFLQTINFGHIANILGPNNCLFIITVPLVNGCEGGAVYDENHNLIGIVMATTFTWKNELANLSLVGNFKEIIGALFAETILQHNELLPVPLHNGESEICFEKSVVLIKSGSSWGTGCLLNVNNFKFIITCSHILDDNMTVECVWKKGQFRSEIIFRNNFFNKPYDIAILMVPTRAAVPDTFFATCDLSKPKTGQQIYAIGFPHFQNLAKKIFAPSIYVGRITKTDVSLFFTDASIQAGQSGGPIFSKNGFLGISISNSKENGTIYPNINMSIPIHDVYPILEDYSKTKDTNILKRLISNSDYLNSLWRLEERKSIQISKL